MNFKNLEVIWTGHSGFLIKFKGKNIYIDPFKLPYNIVEKADIILITHSHYDHCSVQDIDRIVKQGSVIVMPADCQSKILKLQEQVQMKILGPGQELKGGISIRAVKAYNIGKEFHPKDEGWNGYILDFQGVRVYHTGDTDLIPEMKNFGRIDIALLPISGNVVMNYEDAARAVFYLKPELAIPMHYGEISENKEDALRFKEFCENEGFNVNILEIGK